MSGPLSDAALDQIFRTARTHSRWTDEPVSDTTLRALADLVKLGPTSANCSPARLVFVRSAEGKARLVPLMAEGNRAKVNAAPATVIVGSDQEFYEQLPRLFPHTDARSWFAGKPKAIADTAFRNSSLQGAYLIIAARALGLDTGPMSGFDNDGIDAEFFAGTSIKSNFVCSLGHGDPSALRPRAPRFDFADFCSIL